MEIDLQGIGVDLGGFRLRADCRFASGQITAVIGPSGGGKSTLLSLIAGFVQPDRGIIRIGGTDMAGLPPARRPVSMLFQDHNLFAHLSVAQNVGLGLHPGMSLSAEQVRAVERALTAVGLEGMGDRRPGSLSGGQEGRVALARALLRNRPVLLLDEPFAALGPALRHEMLDLVAQVQRQANLTVLMVTHLPQDARRIAGMTSLVADGTVHAPVATAALFDDPPAALRDYLG